MSFSKFQSVWKIISEYRLDVDDESTNEDLKCIICKHLMVDACLNSDCGCHYCYKCISEYMNIEDRYCPGAKEDCKEQNIVIGTNVVRSEMLNKRISRLKVICPNESCACNIELSQMEDHLRLCTKDKIGCPYITIGCNVEGTTKDELETHLHSNTLCHTELLIDLIQNLKNEVNGLKDDVRKSQLEIMRVNEELRDKDERIMVLEERSVDEMEYSVQREEQRQEEMSEQKQQIKDLRKNMMAMVTNLKDVCAKSKLEIISLKEESRSKTVTSESLNKSLGLGNKMELRKNENTKINAFKEERTETNRQSKERKNVTMTVKDPRKNTNEMMDRREMFDYNRDVRMNQCDKLCPIIGADFVWWIDRFSQKINTDMFSESFNANNYKLCLYLNISADNIYFYCHIMKGVYDDRVQWPMKRAVTLAIVDQVTMKAHKSETYKYDTFYYKNVFDRPKNDMSDYIGGSSPFIKYSSIKDKASIIVDDSIIVSCVITDI